MKIKKGIIPIISLIIGMIIYEAIVILFLNWSGIYRTILAGVIGGAFFEYGKRIEKRIIKTESSSNTIILNIIAFIVIFIFIVGLNQFKGYFVNTNKSDNSIRVLIGKTDKHIYIPTTKLYIVPPDEFRFIKELQRFQKNEKTYFQIAEMQGADFSKNEFNRLTFEKKGAQILSWEEYSINKRNAKFCILKADDFTKNMFLAFGDKSFSTMIVGYYNFQDFASEEEIKKAMLSIYYDSSKTINPFENAKFKLELGVDDFKFARYSSNTYIFTENGIMDETNPFQSQFMVQQLPSIGITNYAMENHTSSLIKNFESSGIPKIVIEKSQPHDVNDLYGYLTIGKTKYKSQKFKIYILVLSDLETSIVFTGLTKENNKTELEMFKRLSDNIILTTTNTR